MKKNKIVYVGMTADIIHHGHINILKTAREYGDVVVGLLTDKAASEFRRLPYLNYEQRKIILENISGITKVVPQENWDYAPTLREVKPDFMIHGDDWKTGSQAIFRDLAFKAMAEWGGEIIEVPYTRGVSASHLYQNLIRDQLLPSLRVSLLKRLLESRGRVRIMEAHDALSAKVVESARFEKDGKRFEFDGIWSSSFSDSLIRGLPDNESLELSERLSMINYYKTIITKPILYDIDTGGQVEHLMPRIPVLEMAGISGIVMEDKIGLKHNSLFAERSAKEQMEDPNTFGEKIRAATQSRMSRDFLIFARTEALIYGQTPEQALERAVIYAKSGADGIVIHSNKTDAKGVLEFCRLAKDKLKTYIVAIPSTYSATYESELFDAGINLIIYANHMMRSSIPAMQKCAESILENHRSFESEEICLPIKKALKYFEDNNDPV